MLTTKLNLTKTLTKFFCLTILCVGFYLTTHNTACAQADNPTSKENFLNTWEAYQKSLPSTVKLEKTDELGAYKYETTLFPYKGTLKVLNVIIDKNIDYYYNYDLGLDDVLKGVVEAELPNLPDKNKNIYNTYPHSSYIWRQHNFMFFDEGSEKWLSAEQWREKFNPTENTKNYTYSNLYNIFIELLPLILPLMFLLLILWWAQRKQKTNVARYDLSIERQKESMELQKEALELLREQTEILRNLSEDKRK